MPCVRIRVRHETLTTAHHSDRGVRYLTLLTFNPGLIEVTACSDWVEG